MSQQEMVRRARAVFEQEKSRPPQEGLQLLIEKGIIAEDGQVIFVHSEGEKKPAEPETR